MIAQQKQFIFDLVAEKSSGFHLLHCTDWFCAGVQHAPIKASTPQMSHYYSHIHITTITIQIWIH